METNKLVIGILAHVDSGKTTLAESILYNSGSIRKYGRVDYKDAFLDNFELERSRGITIFAKQAKFQVEDIDFTLLDTPGHVDFSAEMERTLQVIDYALLVINGADGVQGHTCTLWNLLKRYRIPTFIFINKMDQPDTNRAKLMELLKNQLDDNCIDFSNDENTYLELYEEIAMCEENLMEDFLKNGSISVSKIQMAIKNRQLFPCYFGSALKQEGVVELLEGLGKYVKKIDYPEMFGARVFKIGRDNQGNRMTYIKITGGVLKNKSCVVPNLKRNEKMTVVETSNEQEKNEKVNQIRIYSGSQYVTTDEAEAGTICAVMGLKYTFVGEGLGIEDTLQNFILKPALTYKVKTKENQNAKSLYSKLLQLEEENPELHILWNEKMQELQVQVMGVVQIEVLQSLIKERFNEDVVFDTGNIVYKETIKKSVIGIGHFEPLRHYAEVHLKLEPLPIGSGIEYATSCKEDLLDKNWQRLILTHLSEKRHIGVLTGSEITDMRITIIAGKAHLKHTEGGDFRQATYRAIRQGLKSTESILLEPIYDFSIKVPQECVGRTMTDIQRMHGNFESPVIEDGIAYINGICPVSTMRDYQKELNVYSRGYGSLQCTLKGYGECHNSDEVIAQIGYEAESDIENPSSSVFCSHGAGFIVLWDKVKDYAHLNSSDFFNDKEKYVEDNPIVERKREAAMGIIDQEEIDEIFARTFGVTKQKRKAWTKNNIDHENVVISNGEKLRKMNSSQVEEYLLVDGYNIIFAWSELAELAKKNIDSARDCLMDILCNYQGYKKCNLILVFDAYKVSSGKGKIFDYHNIHVVYTKEAETADQYIEKVSHELALKNYVTVATSDRLEQMIIWGAGAKRMSAQGLWEEVKRNDNKIEEQIAMMKNNEKNYLGNYIAETIIENILEGE